MPREKSSNGGPDVVIIILTEDGQKVEVKVEDTRDTSEPQNQDREE